MVKVTFTSHNKEIYCNKGDKLLQVARKADIFIDVPCNGNVSCGKCKVRLIKGKVDTEKTHHIKDEEWNQGYILACNTKVIEDIDIEVHSKLSSSMYGMKIEGSDNRKDKEVFDRAKKIIKENNFKFETNIEKTYIELDEPTLDDNISDIDRIERHIRNSLGYNEIDFTIDLLRKVPTVIRKDNFKVTITYIKKKNKITILNIESGNTENKLYGVAIDIGTTSVVVCLVDLYTKEILDKASSGNAQIKYGADVIHRIVYSTKKNGLKAEKVIKDFAKEQNLSEQMTNELIRVVSVIDEQEQINYFKHFIKFFNDYKNEAIALMVKEKGVDKAQIEEYIKTNINNIVSEEYNKFYELYNSEKEVKAVEKQEQENQRNLNFIAFLISLGIFILCLFLPILIRIEENTRKNQKVFDLKFQNRGNYILSWFLL